MTSALRILLVDDSDAVRLTLGALLEDLGHRVVGAASLAQARARLEETFDAAIIDLHLPDGLGSELFADVRARSPSSAVILLSGADARDPVEGADLVLEKALAPDELVRMLEEVTTTRRARS